MNKEVVQQQQELVALGHGCVTTKAEQVSHPSGVQHLEVPVTTDWNKEKNSETVICKVQYKQIRSTYELICHFLSMITNSTDTYNKTFHLFIIKSATFTKRTTKTDFRLEWPKQTLDFLSLW